MQEEINLAAKIGGLLVDTWLYLIAGLMAVLMWIGRRHINKLDDVIRDYVSQETHKIQVQELRTEMLQCQQGVKADQAEILRQVQSVHKRMDNMMELMIEHVKSSKTNVGG